MKGFRSTPGLSSRPFITNILILIAIGAVLFSSGCSGLVSGNNNIGNPGSFTISNTVAGNATPTTVAIDWQTNAPANSQVEFGATTSYGSMTPVDSTMVTSHQLTVASLTPGTAYHCRVHSTNAQNVSAVSGDLGCSTAKDTTPPTVAITSPVANATLSGTVNLTATASDNVAVASVQFKVDNANSGAALTVAPYGLALNTTTLSDGNHILTAVATDTSGNTATSAGVAVKVNNATSGPSVTSLNPTSGAVGASVTIAGANFGAAQGTSTVTFNGTAAVVSNWSAPSITTTVPAGATTGNVVVTVGGVASNGVNFTVAVPAPSITSLNPTSGVIGTSVTISGANFGAAQGTNTVTFNGTAAVVNNWSMASITTTVPAGATTGNVVVTVGGTASNGVSFTVTVPAPSITSLNPTSGVIGTSVTISGTNFGSTQGTSTVKFNGIAAAPTSWGASSILVPVPAGATTGNVVVTVGGVASNGVSFTVTVPGPSITSLSPSSGVVGTPVTIAGANFGATQGTSTVTFGGIAATPTNWGATSITAAVPAGATTGNILVTVGGVASNGISFAVTVPAPSITSLNPTSGLVGTSVTISGANFGSTQGTSSVKFNGIAATPTSWSATSILVPVPAGATTGNVLVTVGGVASNGVSFTVTVPGPSIATLNPSSGVVGTPVTIACANFGATQGTSTVTFGGIAAAPTSWSATSIIAAVPAGTTTGNVVVTVGGAASNGVSFTVTVPAPSIASLNPTSGVVGTSVTITGANFGATQGTSTVKFNGTSATPTSWSATSITVAVPAGATTGNAVVTVGGAASNGVSFTVTVLAPSISSLNPTSGVVGAPVTIAGANFGASQGTSTVKFNGTPGTATSWNAANIVVPVPAGATTGNVVVTVGGAASNGVSFTVTVPAPSIASLNPTSGAVGTAVTISGSNFGATQGTSTVRFNGTSATPTSWSASSIVAPVPTGATTGSVVVTVNGAASNGMAFTVTTTSPSMGPLKQSTVNSRYFVTPAGQPVYLTGSHTWNDFQDTSSATAPAAFPFSQYVAMLKADGHSATILWHKELPTECSWKNSVDYHLAQQPWLRTGPGTATDGLPKFDLSQFDQTFFDRMRSEALTLQQNGIYAIVELFDGSDTANYRCTHDGYPFTGSNNVNGADDGYSSGTAGVGSFTMGTNNAITNIQDAFVIKMIDTLNDLPNVVWEIGEEVPGTAFAGTSGYGGSSIMTFWAPHMFGLIKTYESGGTWEGKTYPGKAFQHPAGMGSMAYADRNCPEGDCVIYASTADWVAPSVNAGVDQWPAAVKTNNQGKVAINDSDHSISSAAFVNSSTGAVDDVNLRLYIWANFTNGAGGLIFMDPYIMYISSGMRNPCANAVNEVCPLPMSKWDPFRAAMGYTQVLMPQLQNLLAMTPQPSLSSTGQVLANNTPTGFEFVVYSTAASSFTVNLSAQAGRTVIVQWLDPTTGALVSSSSVLGGNSSQTFSAPWGNVHDAVLHLTDGG